MSLTNEERRTLVSLELKKARETFGEIEILTAANRWSGAANRLYYAVFHAINALHINDGHPVNTHKGSHALFHLHYIKTRILSVEFGRLYNQLQTMREKADYNCTYYATEQDTAPRIATTESFIEKIIGLIKK